MPEALWVGVPRASVPTSQHYSSWWGLAGHEGPCPQNMLVVLEVLEVLTQLCLQSLLWDEPNLDITCAWPRGLHGHGGAGAHSRGWSMLGRNCRWDEGWTGIEGRQEDTGGQWRMERGRVTWHL